jgi:hypothetical protein
VDGPPGFPGPFPIRGMACVDWSPEGYASAEGSASRAALAELGANWASLLATWVQDDGTATVIAADPGQPTDAALVAAIRDCHARGLKVMLKPHVEVRDGTWRALLQPADVDAWFTSYTRFILHYADLAARHDVDLLCVDCELRSLSGPRHRERWLRVLQGIRSRYGGLLTYAANAAAVDDEFSTVSFWDQLDLAGLDAYFRLGPTDAREPADGASLQVLVDGWGDERQGVVRHLKAFHDRIGKPVLFTELGFRSVPGASSEPWNFARPGVEDPGEQDRCWQATLQVWSRQTDWWKGLFGWCWGLGRPSDPDYSPRGKPAEATLRAWFRARPQGR